MPVKTNPVSTKRCLTAIFLGKTGAGKSTTINYLFGTSLKTDPAVACTQNPYISYVPDEQSAKYCIVDLPGISESIEADKLYFKFYKKWISKADLIIWLTQADTRAYKQDELFFLRTKKYFKPDVKLVIGLNKVDTLESGESTSMEEKFLSEIFSKNVQEKIIDLHNIIGSAISDRYILQRSDIIPYSSIHNYRITDFKQKILSYV